MKFRVKKTFLTLFLVSSLLGSSREAHALTFGESALTVAVSTGAGAVIGASTLPFYAEPSKNTRNIFYGAALGAVAGVFLASYWGLKETQDQEDEASKGKRERDLNWAWSRSMRPSSSSESLASHALLDTSEHVLLTTSLVHVRF